MKTIHVPAETPYDVMVGYGLFSGLGGEVAKRHAPSRAALVCDETALSLYGARVQASLETAGFRVLLCRIPAGEENKTLANVGALMGQFAEGGISRGDVIVALGGGVTSDVTGMAAALYLRGMPLVQAPTTIGAAIDSAIGGKLAVNLPHGMNTAGLTWHPTLVVCDCDTFESLPREVYLDGVAEALKYGVICDRGLFELVSRGALEEDCLDVIARCASIKAELAIAAEQGRERGRLLDFGRVLGGAIKELEGQTLSHGQSIAMAIAGTTRIAEALGVCVMGSAGIVMAMLDRLELPSEIPYGAEELARAAMEIPGNQGSELSIVLPDSVGHCIIYPVEAADLPRLFRLAKGERF